MSKGKSLKKIRLEKGYSAQEVAEKMGFATHKSITDIEYGLRKISDDELKKLLAIYDASLEDLSEEKIRLAPLFRSEKVLKKEAQDQLLVLENNLVIFSDLIRQTGNKIYSYLNWGTWVKSNYPKPTNTEIAISLGEKLADQFRSELRIGDAPIKDILSITKQLGIKVLGLEFDSEKFSGLFVNLPKLGPIIFINIVGQEKTSRITFSIAHEICHFLVDNPSTMAWQEISESFDANFDNRYNKNFYDIRANAFAASFLLPRSGLLDFIDNNLSKKSSDFDIYDISKIQLRYQTSFTATLYRLLNLRIISDLTFEKLKQEYKNHKHYYENYISIMNDDSSIYKSLKNNQNLVFLLIQEAIDAYYQKKISLGKLQELADNFKQEKIVEDILKLKGRVN